MSRVHPTAWLAAAHVPAALVATAAMSPVSWSKDTVSLAFDIVVAPSVTDG